METITTEVLNKSPMQDFIQKFDNAHLDWGYNDYWSFAYSQDYRHWNALFIEEIKFRKQFGLNLVWSDEGGQGNGKSMGLLRKKQIIDQIYGRSFNRSRFLDEVHFFNEDLEEGLSNTPHQSTQVLDEQTRGHGLMTRFMEDQLANYEDTFRKAQINIGYASPSLRSHSHFFVFEALGDIFIDDKREVTAVNLMLKTNRQSDKRLMPRGILKLRAPDKEIWAGYNDKKDLFIRRMKSREGGVMDRIEKHADQIVLQAGQNLYRLLKDGSKVPAPKKSIEFYMYKIIGMRAYTISGYELLLEAIKQKL